MSKKDKSKPIVFSKDDEIHIQLETKIHNNHLLVNDRINHLLERIKLLERKSMLDE